MLGLFKEQEHQIQLSKMGAQSKQDQVRKEYFKGQKEKEIFNDTLLFGEKARSDVRNAAQFLQAKKCKENIRICEESLGKELRGRKLDALREEKLRQLLWETAPELKELRQQLLLADVARDHAMQLAEKQAVNVLRREEEESLAEAARLEKEKYEAEQKRKEIEYFQAKLEYHKDLDELQHYKRTKRLANKEQIVREQEAIDEIKRKIEEEDFEQARKRMEKQNEYKRQAQELQKVREGLLLREKLQDKVHDLKVDEYRKAQELRAKEQEEQKQLTLEHKLQLQEELQACLESIYAEKLHKEQLQTNLAIEEREAAEREKEYDIEIKKKQIREELERVYDMQMYVKKQKEDLQKKEEELIRRNLMAQLYQEDKLELMSQQKRHFKKLEHMRAAQALIEENRKKKAMERAREVADLKYNEEIESERIKMVNEEKIKFLRNHAKELLGYLPKRVIKDEKTIECLGEDFKKFYFRQGCQK